MSHWKWMTKPTVIEGELFDEPNPMAGGVPLYKQWLYVLVPLTFAFIYWMFGEIIRYWWISTTMFQSPNTFRVNRRKDNQSHDAEHIRDALSL